MSNVENNFIDEIRERVKNPVEIERLSEDVMWQTQNSLIWKARSFDGTPHFYPVYNFEDYYSYSILALIVKKGELALNAVANQIAKKDAFSALPHSELIDLNISRVGCAFHSSNEITDSTEYVSEIVEALKKDINEIEDKNAGYKNVIMCGGKDSLNLLLLPWKNPVVAYSANPNYPLVCEFVKKNDLNIEVKLLEDKIDQWLLNNEALELCSRMNAVHWRWGHHIAEIAKSNDGKAIIWKGQMGDLYMATRWKTYGYGTSFIQQFLMKVYNKTSKILPSFINSAIARMIIPGVEERVWQYGANAQGAHLAFMRAISGCLVLSAYHGRHMQNVLKKVDLGKAVQKDVRQEIGVMLLGRDVVYPDQNPHPEVSNARAGLHNPDLLIKLLKENNINVIE